LHGNAKPTNTLKSADTTRHASSYTRQYATPQRYEAHYTARTTYASSRRTQVLKTKPRKRSSISSITTPTHAEKHPTEVPHQTSTEWLEPLPPEVETRHRRHTDVSQDPRYDQAPTAGDSECTEAPIRITDWILPHETQEALFKEGHGTAPDLIYARGVPDSPSPDPSTFDRKQCILIIFEVGFCQDLGCPMRLQEKTAKYAPLVNALKALWGKVVFVAIPVGHAGTTLKEMQRHLAQALSATRPEIKSE
jgi:hypothetical protein